MKRILLSAALICIALGAMAQKVTSPDGKMELSFALDNGRLLIRYVLMAKRWLLLPILVTSLKRRMVRRVLIFDWKPSRATDKEASRKADFFSDFTLEKF